MRRLVVCLTLVLSGCVSSPVPDICDVRSNANLHFLVLTSGGTSISGVEVSIAESLSGAATFGVTEYDGVASFECIPSGSYQVSFAKSGFSSFETSVEAFPHDRTVRTVYLQPRRF